MVLNIKQTNRTIVERQTSYEIVCATLRRAPTSEYFEFETNPQPRTEKISILKIKIKTNTPKEKISIRKKGIPIHHREILKIKPTIGKRINQKPFDGRGRTNSLTKSLIASPRGWSNPTTPTLLGPFRF